MRLLTAEEVARDLLAVPTSHVYALARAKAIPHVRIGRYVRFDAGDVQRWLDEQKDGGRGR